MLPADVSGAPPGRRVEPLLEREGELGVLEQAVRSACDGVAGLVVVEGPAGIGKTRLVAEARRAAAAAGMRVAAARGSELEREFPFGVVRQLFEPLLREPRLLEAGLSGSAAAARPIFESLEEEQGSGDGVSFAALHGLYWLTVNLASEKPLLLAVDDLHWIDRPSLRFVSYLAHRLEGLPVLVLASLRPAEPGADAALLGEILGDPLTLSVAPPPLSQAGVDELVREHLGALPGARFGAVVREATGGNPLLLHELLRALREEAVRPDDANADIVRELGPRAVSRSVLVRLARLDPAAIEVARAAAVLGDDADLRTVAGLAGLDDDAAGAGVAALARAEIVRPGAPLAFVHPLVRAAVYEDLSPQERERRHAAAARILADADRPPEQVAAHLLALPPSGEPRFVDTLTRAARVAQGRGAAESAVAYLGRALDEPPPLERRPSLLLELGMAEMHVNAPAAAEHLRAAYEALDEPALRGAAAAALARTLLFTSPPDEAVDVARRAAAELPPELVDLRQALEALQLVAVHFGADPAGTTPRFERARTHREGDGPGARMLAAIAAWEWALVGGSAEECSELSLAALSDGVLLAADPSFMTVVAAVVLVLADREEALGVWDGMMAEAHRRGSLFTALGVNLWRGWTQLHRGDLGEAESSIRKAREETILWGTDVGGGGPFVAGILSRVLLERGELVAARAALSASGLPTSGVNNGEIYCRRSEVELLLAEGRPAEAADAADELAVALGRCVNPAWAPWRSLKSEALVRLGRRDEAVALAQDELPLARHWGAPSAVGRTLRAVGVAQGEQGLPVLEEAIATLERSPARLELARALAAYGTALRLARRPTEAREPLRRALELASACESPPLAEHVRSELHAAGLRPRSSAVTGVDALTASERRVARFAADGHSNREIAQTLYVTPKTVEVHLSNAYRKLGIRSRKELVRVLEAV